MARLGWLKQENGQAHGSINPHFGVLHSTIGTYDGSYSVGMRGYFHFMVGKDGRGVQFVDTNELAYHVGGPNGCSVGIEFEGQNYDYLQGTSNRDPLTPQQIEVGGRIIREVSAIHGIPLSYFGEPHDRPHSVTCGSGFRGWASHVNCDSSPADQHFDYVSGDQFALMVGGSAPTPIPTSEEDDMATFATLKYKDANPRPIVIDAAGNLVQQVWGGKSWVNQHLTGPNGETAVKDKAVAALGTSAAVGGFGDAGRVDLFARSEGGKTIHATYLPATNAWSADLIG